MNIVLLKGNLTRDPEVKYLATGRAVCEFSVAVNRTWVDDHGEKHEKASFHECRCWGKRGETIARYFGKGRPILVKGYMDQEQWEDRETGKKRSKTLVLVEEFEFCGGEAPNTEGSSRTDAGARPTTREGACAPRPANRRPPGVGDATGRESLGEVFPDGTAMAEDDIPF